MAFEIILKNNFLLVNDLSTGLQHEALAKDVLIRKLQPASESYAFVGVVGMSTTPIPFTELRNGVGGSVWASVATWETWYTENLGKSSGGGGGSFVPSEHDLDEFQNENADPFARMSDVPSSSDFVPYTGATQTLDLGERGIITSDLGIGSSGAGLSSARLTLQDNDSGNLAKFEVEAGLDAETVYTFPNKSITIAGLDDIPAIPNFADYIKYGQEPLVLDGVEVFFAIAHGLGEIPSSYNVFYSDGSITELQGATVSVDATNININCNSAPTGDTFAVWQVYKQFTP